jgi:hypothetical protein
LFITETVFPPSVKWLLSGSLPMIQVGFHAGSGWDVRRNKGPCGWANGEPDRSARHIFDDRLHVSIE